MLRLREALSRLVAGRAPLPARALIDTKGSRAGPLLTIETLGRPVWAPRDYGTFAREGYAQNAIVHRCVRMTAEACASIPLLLYERGREIEAHPLVDLLRRPSPGMTGTDLLESWYGFLLVAGNAYMEAVAIDGEVRELHALRPDRMKVVPGPDGWPEAWEYEVAGRSVRFAGEVADGVRPILHLKLFNPANDHYGLSPIEAAAIAIDIHNEAARWNKALLDNSARPSGALVYGAGHGQMTGEQFERLKRELEATYQGSRHAGRPLLLEGGLDWKPLSLSPKDMDFIEAKNAAAREIALALGVPPMLLGIPGDNTYSNYQEASRAFWRQTVLPLVGRTARALSEWLGGGTLELRADLDDVEALSPEREALWTRLDKATFLTRAEKRTAAGYGDVEVGREAQFDPEQPRVPAGGSGGGQWTSGDDGTDLGGEEGLSGDDAQLIPAFLGPAAATIEALLTLFTTWSLDNSEDRTAVLEFNAKEFLPGETPTKDAIEVGRRTREQVDDVCSRHGEVQSLTNQAAETVRRDGNHLGATEYGTKVHTELKRQVELIADRNFRAEVSAIKSEEAGYGARRSIRVDVLENVGDGTVCVYDIKTGYSRLTPARMSEIASNVRSLYKGTQKILVIETRPR